MTVARKKPDHLRTVGADEIAPRKDFRSITEAANDGTARDLLVQMRNRIAKTLDEPNCPARDQASLSRRLLEIRKEIDAIDAEADQEAAEDAEVADEALDAEAL